MSDYHKRTYKNLREAVADFCFMARNRKQLRAAMQLVPEAFRERLLLAVTQVNGCRYCAYYHAKMALQGGMTPDEIEAIMKGIVGDCPQDEITALLYAQHWAEAEGYPDPTSRARVVEVYGEEKTRAIESLLRMIKMGNYMGNTFDYFLYRLSGGQLANK